MQLITHNANYWLKCIAKCKLELTNQNLIIVPNGLVLYHHFYYKQILPISKFCPQLVHDALFMDINVISDIHILRHDNLILN